MGTWDAGPFDNDSAADFANDLDDAPEHQRVAMIRAALTAAVENDDYLDLGEGAPAVAAAALVAYRLPGGEQFASNSYGPDAPVSDLPADLIPLAISAVERVLGDDSELAALWSEDMRAQRPWHTSMQSAEVHSAQRSDQRHGPTVRGNARSWLIVERSQNLPTGVSSGDSVYAGES